MVNNFEPDIDKGKREGVSNIDIKVKAFKENLMGTPGYKLTQTRDAEGSMQSSAKGNDKNNHPKIKNKLSKRDSVFFKPTEKDIKALGDIIVKVA